MRNCAWCVLAGLVLIGMPALGGEAESGMSAEMAENMARAATPNEHHLHLAELAGDQQRSVPEFHGIHAQQAPVAEAAGGHLREAFLGTINQADMDAADRGKLLAVEMMFSFYFGMYSGTMLGALVEIVPAHVRTTCFSLAFALAAALFGTFTPFASTWLIEQTGNKAMPGAWLMFAAALGIIAAMIVYRGGGKAVPTYDTAAEPVAGH